MSESLDPHRIGTPCWREEDLRASLSEFNEVLARAPFTENQGGMGPQHMFGVWSIARSLRPSVIVESGVWKGAGTWLLHEACPEANLVCIEPCPDHIQFRIPSAQYLETDFDLIDWSGFDRERTLVFFDDHQNAWERLKSAYTWGFRHLIFEDNYPPGAGDCYSPKKIFSSTGHTTIPPSRSFSQRVRDRMLSYFGASAYRPRIPPNTAHQGALSRIVDVYAEFPPVVAPEVTRFGDSWESIPAPDPLFGHSEHPELLRFIESAEQYTYLCYVKLVPPHRHQF